MLIPSAKRPQNIHQITSNGALAPRALWWDADPQKEVLYNCRVYDWPDKLIDAIHTRELVIADCLGDHRGEIVAAYGGELRIYTTTIPASDRHPCLMQDRQYRLGIAAQTMGYYYPAQLGEGGRAGRRAAAGSEASFDGL
jgi:hypothetical protein